MLGRVLASNLENIFMFTDIEAIKQRAEQIKKSIIYNYYEDDPKMYGFVIDVFSQAGDVEILKADSGIKNDEVEKDPYVIFMGNDNGKKLIETCFDLMTEKLLAENLAITDNLLINKLEVFCYSNKQVLPIKVLKWSYEVKDNIGTTYKVLDIFKDSFYKGFGINY